MSRVNFTSSPSFTKPLRYHRSKWDPCIVYLRRKLSPTIITLSLFLVIKSICSLSRKPPLCHQWVMSPFIRRLSRNARDPRFLFALWTTICFPLLFYVHPLMVQLARMRMLSIKNLRRRRQPVPTCWIWETCVPLCSSLSVLTTEVVEKYKTRL